MLKEVMIKLLNQKLKLEMLIPCDKKEQIKNINLFLIDFFSNSSN